MLLLLDTASKTTEYWIYAKYTSNTTILLREREREREGEREGERERERDGGKKNYARNEIKI